MELVTHDRPGIVALQEVPLWALGRLESWSGMTVRWAVTVPALLLGPLARLVTQLDPVRLRSLVTGQANVVLVDRALGVGDQRLLLLTTGVTKWEWLVKRGLQQRYCQAVEVDAAGAPIVVANVHATNDPVLAEPEVRRAAAFVGDAERCILCGDFNVSRLAVADFSAPIEGLDQILVRGLELERAPRAWEPERRRVDGLLLSDHAPVEAVIA